MRWKIDYNYEEHTSILMKGVFLNRKAFKSGVSSCTGNCAFSFFISCSWNKNADFCGPGHFSSQLPHTLVFRQCFLQHIDFLLFKLLNIFTVVFFLTLLIEKKHNKKSPKPPLVYNPLSLYLLPKPFYTGLLPRPFTCSSLHKLKKERVRLS